MFQHADIWRAIDRLAEQQGLSVSALAQKAGLSSTVFNPSKRTHEGRKRWPSTESVQLILRATGRTIDDFIGLMDGNTQQRKVIPLIGYGAAGQDSFFDEAGYPTGRGWEEIAVPVLDDPHLFAIEVTGNSMEPVYREGDRLIVSPAASPRRGDRVVARTNAGEVMTKQLGRETAAKIELVSLNPAHPSMTFARRDLAWIYRIIWVSQ